MFRKAYLILSAICLLIKIVGVITVFFGRIYSCDYPSLCDDLDSYIAISLMFFYIDPLLLLITLIWLIRTVKRIEKYPKENILIAFSWIIAISFFAYLMLTGFNG